MLALRCKKTSVMCLPIYLVLKGWQNQQEKFRSTNLRFNVEDGPVLLKRMLLYSVEKTHRSASLNAASCLITNLYILV